MSQSTLANVLGVGESTVRNWENERVAIPATADRLLRAIYIGAVDEGEEGRCHVRELIEHISQLNRDAHWERMELVENENGWKLVA